MVSKLKSKIKSGSRWILKDIKPKTIVKVYSIEKDGVHYGTLSSKAAHITQSIRGFLENYEIEK